MRAMLNYGRLAEDMLDDLQECHEFRVYNEERELLLKRIVGLMEGAANDERSRLVGGVKKAIGL